MSSEESKRTTTALRVKVRHPDLDTFVERFAVNVGRSGLFIPTPAPKPIGSEVRFEVRLADDRAVLIGQGVVRWIREPLPERSRATTGMAIELQRVSRDSRDVLVRMLHVRKRRGLVDGPGGLPLIEDEDSEESRSGQFSRQLTVPPPAPTAAVPAAVPESLSVAVPVTVPVTAPIPDPVSIPATAPMAVAAVAEAAPEPVAEAAPEPVADAAPEPVADAAPEPVADAAPEPVAEAAPEPIAEAAPEPVAEAAPEPATEAAPEPEPLPAPPRVGDDAVALTAPEPAFEPIPPIEPVPEAVVRLEVPPIAAALDAAEPPSDGDEAEITRDRTSAPGPAEEPEEPEERTREVAASRVPSPPPLPDWAPRPRRGPLRLTIPPAPEPLRPRAVAPEPDLEGFDLDAVFERARALTAHADDDPAALPPEPTSALAAVPTPITADEASARLAAMLGTAPPPRRAARAQAAPITIPPLPPRAPQVVPPPLAPPPPPPIAPPPPRAVTVPTTPPPASTMPPAASRRVSTESDSDAGWDDEELGRTPPPAPLPIAVDGLPGVPLAALPQLPRSTRAGTMPIVAIPPRPPGPVTRPPPTTTAPPPVAPVAAASPPAEVTVTGERRRFDREWIERQEAERERAERERAERERADAVRRARLELSTIDPLSEPLDEPGHDHRISLAESLAPMDSSNIELAPAMGFLDELELDDRRGRRAATMPLAPPRAQIPPSDRGRVRRGSTPPPPPRSVPIPAATTGAPATTGRPAAFTGRHDDSGGRHDDSGGRPAPTAPPPVAPPKLEAEAALEALDETTQVASPATSEVDLDAEHDVEIEFDDAT